MGSFYIFTIAHYSFPEKFKMKYAPTINNFWYLGFVIVVTGFYCFFYGKTLKPMYADIRFGIAKRYDQEMIQRYEHIRASKSDTVCITPLKNVPKSLCFDEIKTNEKHLWNKCYATYFEKKVIILKEK